MNNTKLSNEIVRAFANSKYFDSKLLNISDNVALRLIKQNKADLFIVIPHNFERNLIHSKNAEVGVFIDGSFPLRATTLEGYVNGMFLNVLQKNGIKAPFKVNQRNLFNESMRDENAIIPGVIGLALLIAPSILAALSSTHLTLDTTVINDTTVNITHNFTSYLSYRDYPLPDPENTGKTYYTNDMPVPTNVRSGSYIRPA